MDDFINSLRKILQKIRVTIYTLYNNLGFLFNKQRTLQKIYEPILKEKHKENEGLKYTLDSFKLQNKNIQNNIEKLQKENIKLNNNTKIIKELLVKK